MVIISHPTIRFKLQYGGYTAALAEACTRRVLLGRYSTIKKYYSYEAARNLLIKQSNISKNPSPLKTFAY